MISKLFLSFERIFFKLSLKTMALFGFIWLMVGFTSGTSTLMGPVRWFTSMARSAGWGHSMESGCVKGIILAYVTASFFVACWLTGIMLKTAKKHIKVLIPLVCFLCTAGALYLFLNPATSGLDRGEVEDLTEQFTFGPYPTEERLTELKRQGYTGVISLLHPAVVPFEPKLLADEQEVGDKVGIRIIHVPMLPWVSENKESLAMIKDLASRATGRYYVHCYLGKDRVFLVKRVIETVAPKMKIGEVASVRTLHNIADLERGLIIQLADNVYLTPFPTDEEFASYIIRGEIKQVVSLLTREKEADRQWIEKEKQNCEDYGIAFLSLPVSTTVIDPNELLAVARRLKTLPRPMVVHAFRSDSHRAQSFTNAFLYDLPPLVPSMFEDPIINGRVALAGPNVAVGPAPTEMETKTFFRERGIFKFIFAGDPESVQARDDRRLFGALGLDWKALDPRHHNVFESVKEGGPWYVYGQHIVYNNLALCRSFERGPVHQIDLGVYVTPFPTQDEITRFYLQKDIQSVVTLLDPGNDGDRHWLDMENAALAGKKNLHNFAFSPTGFDAAKMLEIARKVKTLPKPVIVHAYKSDSPRAMGFIQAYQTDLPPLPPGLMSIPLASGLAEPLAPHIAVGPRPTAHEFSVVLPSRGVKRFIYMGAAGTEEALADKTIAANMNVNWQVQDPDVKGFTYQFAVQEGPWYLYGPRMPEFRRKLASRYGPLVPGRVMRYQDTEITKWREPEKKEEAKSLSFVTRFLDEGVPELRLIFLLGPILLVYSMLAAAFAGWLRMSKEVRTPYTRKTFHFLIFTAACFLQYQGGLQSVCLFGSIVSLCVLYAVWRGNDFPFYEAMARPTDEPHRTMFIIIPLITTALGGVTSNMFFGQFAAVGYLCGGWGDAVGEPVGSRWGKHKYKCLSLAGVPATRSLEGSAAVMLVSMAAAFLALVLGGFVTFTALKIAIVCGIAGASVEAVSNHGLDNFTIQVATSATAFFFLG